MNRFVWWLTCLAALGGLSLIVLSQWSIVSPQRRTVSFDDSRRLILIGWLVLMAGCSALPFFQRFLLSLIRRLRQVTTVARRRTTILIFILATAWLLLTARFQHRDLNMNIQDEMMYLVQAQMLAHGHLCFPAHPMADFFQELFIFHTPVYASMYFPGTALLYAGAILLHIPNWVLAAGVSGAGVALVYRVFAELLDGAAGVLGALLLIACASFRWASIMVMSHPLAMLQGLLMFWCFLRWRRAKDGSRWMILFGVLAGWAAITRPLDAIALALPLLVCIAIELYRRERAQQIKAVLLIAGAAAPFIALQLFFDKGVTGHWLQTPVQAYHQRYFPVSFDHGESPAAVADLPAQLPQLRTYYEQFIVKASIHYREENLIARFPYAMTRTLPTTWLLFFVPLGIVALARRTHLAMAAVFVLFVLLYMTYPYFVPHYLIVIMPAGLFLVLLGARDIELVRYYAQRQPQRIFYQYQQEARQLIRLGTAAELLGDPKRLQPPEMLPASTPRKSPRKGERKGHEPFPSNSGSHP
jgi:4-amino-4-deoxy-L-arabinose transferase-like glycosyltransferase